MKERKKERGGEREKWGEFGIDSLLELTQCTGVNVNYMKLVSE